MPCLRVAFLFIVALLSTACSSGLDAIFAGIESEVKVLTNNLNDKISSFGMVKVGDYYIIASGTRLFRRKVQGTNWSEWSIPSGYVVGRELVGAGNEAYVLATNETENKSKIFKIQTGVGSSSIEFVPVDNGIGAYIQKILYVATDATSGTLLAQTKESSGGGYKVYANSQSTVATPLSLSNSVDEEKKMYFPFLQDSAFITENISTERIFILTETQLYTMNATGTQLTQYVVQEKEEDGSVIGSRSGGIAYIDALKSVYITDYRGSGTTSGKAYIWQGAIDSVNNEIVWTRSTAYSGSYFFTDFAYIERSEEPLVLLGTRYKNAAIGRDWGFREFVVRTDENSRKVININSFDVPRGSYYSSVNLDESAVLGFYIDSDTIFVLTRNGGLWRGSYSGSRTVAWFLE